MKVQQNFITNKNEVREGLNFIVPALWWKKFLNKNQKIRSIKQMRLAASSPLDLLYEVGIIQQHSSQHHRSSKSLKKDAQEMFDSIKRQIKEALTQQKIEGIRKRQLVSNESLFQTNQNQSQTQDLCFYSPELKQDIVQLFDMGDEAWVVITPELYRHIWLKQLQAIKDHKKKLIAIPIVLRKEDIQNFDKPIIFNNRVNIQVYFKKSIGQDFVFRGFIEEELTIYELIKYLDEGLFHLFKGYRQEKKSLETNMFLLINNNTRIYYSSDSQPFFQNLGWVHFRHIKDKKLKEQPINVRLHFFETNITQENDIENQSAESDKVTLNNQPQKKIKLDTSIQTSFLDDISNQNEDIFDDQYLNQECQTTQQMHQTPNQALSLTNQETAGQANKNEISDLPLPDFTRIQYPLWKQTHQTQNLYRYGQLKATVPKIFKPYCDQSTMILKEEGKKTVLPRSCNKLNKQEDELVQVQKDEPLIELAESAPSEAVHRQLQILALQILGIKISEEIMDAQKIEQIDWAKSNSEEEIKTCKNEFMDEFDCQQSRQF